jgi:hypothetical protein
MKTTTETNQFVDMDERHEDTYRITFTCYYDDYIAIENEIKAYGEIIKRERKK